MTKQNRIRPILFILILAFSIVCPNINVKVQAANRDIIFPVIGKSSFSNDYNAPRDGGDRVHHAIDIIANKRQPLVAAASGTIVDVQYPQPSWGYSVTIRDTAGYKYRYIHMNDDTPGTNDGKGGPMNAYAVDMNEGNAVVKGQLLGWVGDSGRANGIPHLHFEMFKPSGDVMNPYESLRNATKISSPKNYPALDNEILPSGTKFKSRISLDMGNFDIDPDSEIVTATGKGGRYVKIFDTNGTQIGGFTPYGPNFKGGISVAAGDIDGDSDDEIITGAGPGGGPRVSVFELDGTLINSFYAYSQTFKGGIDVASADVSGTANDEIITGAGPGGGPHVAIWQSDGTALDDFFPYSRDFRGGVRVSAGNIRTGTPKAEIITVPASKGNPTIRMYSGTGSYQGIYYFIEQWWRGYNDVAASEGVSYAATGLNRRDSIREGIE